MKTSIKISLASVMLMFTIFLTSTVPSKADGVIHRTQTQKDSFLSMVCADFNMLTRQGQSYCMQEMYGQSLEFAQSFFAAMDINVSNKSQRIQEWRAKVGLDKPADLTEDQKTNAESDVVYLIGYGGTCQMLSDTVMNPEQLLGLSDKTVDTLLACRSIVWNRRSALPGHSIFISISMKQNTSRNISTRSELITNHDRIFRNSVPVKRSSCPILFKASYDNRGRITVFANIRKKVIRP